MEEKTGRVPSVPIDQSLFDGLVDEHDNQREAQREYQDIRFRETENKLERILLDPKLSAKAKGLSAYIIYLQQNNKKVTWARLINHSDAGIYSIKSGLEEIEDKGYDLPDPAGSPKSMSGRLKLKVLRKQSICENCGKVGNAQIDHIKPLSKGGTHTEDNLQVLCATCNQKKGDKWEG